MATRYYSARHFEISYLTNVKPCYYLPLYLLEAGSIKVVHASGGEIGQITAVD
jgi:hypothetical protein